MFEELPIVFGITDTILVAGKAVIILMIGAMREPKMQVVHICQ